MRPHPLWPTWRSFGNDRLSRWKVDGSDPAPTGACQAAFSALLCWAKTPEDLNIFLASDNAPAAPFVAELNRVSRDSTKLQDWIKTIDRNLVLRSRRKGTRSCHLPFSRLTLA
jgi:hypothetical protein